MTISPQRKIALFLAALILGSGALLLLLPAGAPAPPVEVENAAEVVSGEVENSVEAVPGEAGEAAVAGPELGADYGMMLIKMIIALGLVCLLAYAVLRWGVGRLAGGRAGGEHMQVLGRLALGPNRTIMVVQVGPRFLVLGNTETEISLLSELSAENAQRYFATQAADK